VFDQIGETAINAVAKNAETFGAMDFRDEELEVTCRAVRALSSPARLRIMCLLLEGERSVAELTRRIDNHTQSSVSQHLGFLLKAGIVENRKHGTQMRYRIVDERVQELMVLIEQIFCSRHNGVPVRLHTVGADGFGR